MSIWNAETADWYAAKYGEYATNRLGVDALDLSDDDVVIDIGCGTGAALRHAASRVHSGRLVGVDPVPRMLDIAMERAAPHPEGHRIEFFEAPVERIPIADGCADIVLAFDSLEHWADEKAGLAEILRVLKPNGRFAVVKDGGLPGSNQVRRNFAIKIAAGGFRIVSEQQLSEGDVACTLWICVPTPR